MAGQTRGSEFQTASGRVSLISVTPCIEPRVVRRPPDIADQKAAETLLAVTQPCSSSIVKDTTFGSGSVLRYRRFAGLPLFRACGHSTFGSSRIRQGMVRKIRSGVCVHDAFSSRKGGPIDGCCTML